MSDDRAPPPATITPQETASWSEAVWLERLASVVGAERRALSPLATVLPPMLVALGWSGTGRNLAALLPPPDTPLSDALLQRLLSDLGFRARPLTASGDASDTLRLRAGSLIERSGLVAVYLGQPYGKDLWWTAAGEASFAPAPGDAILAVERDPGFHPASESRPDWFRDLFERMRDQLFAVFAMSGFINLLAISVAFYTMQVYSVVIPSGTTDTVWGIVLLASAAVISAWALKIGRQVVMSRMGRWPEPVSARRRCARCSASRWTPPRGWVSSTTSPGCAVSRMRGSSWPAWAAPTSSTIRSS